MLIYLESRNYRNQQGHWTQVFSGNSVHFLYRTLISVKSEFLKKSKYQPNFSLWCWATWRVFWWNFKKWKKKWKTIIIQFFFLQGSEHFLPAMSNNFLTPFTNECIKTWLNLSSTTTSAHLITRKLSHNMQIISHHVSHLTTCKISHNI